MGLQEHPILVVGGAGYIGSHTVKHLRGAGYPVFILDDLSTGHERLAIAALGGSEKNLYRGSSSDSKLVSEILTKNKINTVYHFAARAWVGESVENPILYYQRNVAETVSLLDTMIKNKVLNFIFSSTCSVYGIPQVDRIDENQPKNPINPYGKSKLMVEEILKDLSKAHGLNAAILRYFNAAGADSEGILGEYHDPETHLIPNAILSSLGKKETLTVFGNDYKTKDGSCIRDYIHVEDLANAHKLAMLYILKNPGCHDFNLGSENGDSVFDVIKMIEKVIGKKLEFKLGSRREGDPPMLVGNSKKSHAILNWKANHNLESIIRSAYQWHYKN